MEMLTVQHPRVNISPSCDGENGTLIVRAAANLDKKGCELNSQPTISSRRDLLCSHAAFAAVVPLCRRPLRTVTLLCLHIHLFRYLCQSLRFLGAQLYHLGRLKTSIIVWCNTNGHKLRPTLLFSPYLHRSSILAGISGCISFTPVFILPMVTAVGFPSPLSLDANAP